MPFLADLFNPTFFMFLGIVILMAAILVVYFESKMREQNHKIAAMLSLVSTLAEDMNGVKIGLHHLAVSKNPLAESNISLNIRENDRLIEVSDDSDSDDDDADSDDDENEEDDDENEEDDDENEEDDNNIKVLKININSENFNNNLEFNYGEDINDGEDIEDINDGEDLGDINDGEDLGDLEEGDLEEGDLEEGDDDNIIASEILNISSSNLRTININLEESPSEILDYKKLPLPKLRSIVFEKGLTTDASKLKKPELIKLLEA